jgi:hypothetical protein
MFKVSVSGNDVATIILQDGGTFEISLYDVPIAQVEFHSGNAVVTVVEQGGVIKGNVIALAEIEPQDNLGGYADGAIMSDLSKP